MTTKKVIVIQHCTRCLKEEEKEFSPLTTDFRVIRQAISPDEYDEGCGFCEECRRGYRDLLARLEEQKINWLEAGAAVARSA